MERDRNNPEKSGGSRLSSDSDSLESKDDKKESKSKKANPEKATEAKRAKFFAEKEKDTEKSDDHGAESEGEHAKETLSEDDSAQKEEHFDLYHVELDDSKEDAEEDSFDPEHLTDTEVSEAILAIVEARTEEIGREISEVEEDSAEEIELIASVAYLESLKDLVEQTQEPTENTVVEAHDFVSENLDDIISSDIEKEISDIEIDKSAEEVVEATGTEPSDSEPSEDTYEGDSESSNSSSSTSSSSVGSATRSGATTGSSSGRSGGGGRGSGSSPLHYHGAPPPTGPDVVVIDNSTHTVETKERVVYKGRRSDMLVGAILGYIVGRRGGRKRTEKKLLPKIESLEKEVSLLNETITEKEEKIRQQARELTEAKQKDELTEISAKMVDRAKLKKAIQSLPEQTEKVEEIGSDERKKQIKNFSFKKVAIFIDSSEISDTDDKTKPENVKIDTKIEITEKKTAEIMSTIELLQIVEGVKVDNEYIVDLFKMGRLDEKSLLEIVKVYQEDGKFEQIVRRELKTSNEEIEQKRETLEKVRKKSNNSGSDFVDSQFSGDLKKSVKIGSHQDDVTQEIFNHQKQQKQQSDYKKLLEPWVLLIVAGVTLLIMFLISIV